MQEEEIYALPEGKQVVIDLEALWEDKYGMRITESSEIVNIESGLALGYVDRKGYSLCDEEGIIVATHGDTLEIESVKDDAVYLKSLVYELPFAIFIDDAIYCLEEF